MRNAVTISGDGSIPYIITIQKALTTLRFSTWNETIVTSDGDTFPPGVGAGVTNLQFTSDGSVANACDVVIMATDNGPILPGDGARGVLDNWPILVEFVDPTNISGGTYHALSGTIGSVDEDGNGMVTIAANGQLRLAQQKPVCEHFTLTGREDLGDNRCKVPLCLAANIGAFDIGRGQTFFTKDGEIISGSEDMGLLLVSDAYGRFRSGGTSGDVEDYANVVYECTTAGDTDATTAPTYPTTPGATVTDGTAVFTCRDAFTRHARGYAIDAFNIQLDALPDPRATDATWFVNGGIYFRSGNLNGFNKFPVRAWDPDTFIATLFVAIEPEDVPADTQIEIHAGCDLTREMCNLRFDNIINLRAETFVPPPDLSMSMSAL